MRIIYVFSIELLQVMSSVSFTLQEHAGEKNVFFMPTDCKIDLISLFYL